jgi:hypothetical protein
MVIREDYLENKIEIPILPDLRLRIRHPMILD